MIPVDHDHDLVKVSGLDMLLFGCFLSNKIASPAAAPFRRGIQETIIFRNNSVQSSVLK